jgi:hypothetical protein
MPTATGLTQQLYLNLDLTGQSPDNLIDQEPHTTRPSAMSIVRPIFGRYYSDSLRVYALVSEGELVPLVKGTDYTFAQIDVKYTELTGLDVYEAIIVKTPSPTGAVYIRYQAVGAPSNPNKPYVDQIVKANGLNTAIDYSSIQAIPSKFYPNTHTHDLKDLFGLEYVVKSLTDLVASYTAAHSTYNNTGVTYKDYQIYQSVTSFKTQLNSAVSQVSVNINEHIGNTGYPHTYTSEMVGLGEVHNYDFGTTSPYYASPATVRNAIDNPPTATVYTHATQTNNPHSTTKELVGLGNVLNYSMLTTYTVNSLEFQTILSDTNEQYLSNYVAINVVAESQNDQINTYLNDPIATMTSSGGSISNLNQQVVSVQTSISGAQTSLAQASTTQQSIASDLQTLQDTNTLFNLINYNKPLAEGLKSILAFDYANKTLGYSVGNNGYWNLPPYIPKLYCWLSTDYSGNTVVTDSNNVPRLLSLVDRSANARVFAAKTASQAPYYADSVDIASGAQGVTVGKVMKFTPGNYLDQISGPPVALRPGMTIFLVVRPNASTTPFTVITETSTTPKAYIRVQGTDNRAIDVDTTDGWSPIKAPANSIEENKSTIVVASVSATSKDYCWLASSMPISQQYPKGVDDNVSVWPINTYVSSAMSRLGSTDAQGVDGGELSEMLIYNGQLSLAECTAIVEYLRLVKSNDQDLNVDFSALNAF